MTLAYFPMTHSGEFATISVKCAIEGGRLAGVQLDGIFNVEPESATAATIAAIGAALTGRPIDLPRSAYAAHIRAAIPFSVELRGTTPDAIALAVLRALGRDDGGSPPLESVRIGQFTVAEIDRLTAEWRDVPWRLIPEVSRSPAQNVALDEVLSDAVARGDSTPLLRFWRWSEPAVVVGRCQSIANEVDAIAAEAMGVRIVRRTTGGGAMFVQPGGAITYSLILPESLLAGLNLRQSYEVCEAWVIRALRSLGVDAHHVPINDIACPDGKIGGAAQARRKGVVLHHTTMAYDMEPGEMASVLRIGREKLKDRAVASAAKRVSPLVRQTARSREEIVAVLFDSFRNRYGGAVEELRPAELDAANRLVESKYGHAEWTNDYA